MGLELEDGQPLDAVLARVTPSDSPLEGSLLAWIFNPVFFKTGTDEKTKAWADFAGGGMAVFEDRFFAESYFEFRAFEAVRAVDLLYALRLASGVGTPVASTKELLPVIVAAEKTRSHDARSPLPGPLEGWSDLVRVWNFQFQLHQVRSSRRSLWPLSFTELREWIDECRTEGEDPRPGTEGSFFQELGKLVQRRFPTIDRLSR